MKHRSPIAVVVLSLITFGIYTLVWQVKTKGELNRMGASIPTAWLLIVPLANLYWVWKYCEGVEQVSGGKISAVLSLVLILVLSVVGMAILQSEFNNKLGPQATVPAGPAAPEMTFQQPAQTAPSPEQPFQQPPTQTPPSV